MRTRSLVRRETCYDSLVDCRGGLATDSSDDGVQRVALNEREQSSAVASADHSISFPVAEPTFGIDNARTLIDRDLVGDDTATIVGTAALASFLLTAKIVAQVSARAFASVDVLVDALMGDANTWFVLKPPRDLLRTPVLADQILQLPPYGTAEPLSRGRTLADRRSSARRWACLGRYPINLRLRRSSWQIVPLLRPSIVAISSCR